MKRLLIALLLAGCASSTMPPQYTAPYTALSQAVHQAPFLYVTDRNAETLSVFKIGQTVPVRVVSLEHAGGVAVDKKTGNVYVASGRNVLEYAPGATRLVRKFSAGLVDAVNVAVSGGALYVADDGPQPGTPAGKIVVFGTNARTIPTPNGRYPHALAVDAKGDIFYETSGIPDAWPFDVNCLAINLTYEIPAGTLNPVQIHIRNHPRTMRIRGKLEIVGEQDWGFALRGTTLYVSDACLGLVKAYYPPSYGYQTSKYIGTWGNLPFYPGIGSDFLAIPQARTGQVFLSPIVPNLGRASVLSNLSGPIGTAVSP